MCDQGLPLGMDTTSRRTGQEGRTRTGRGGSGRRVGERARVEVRTREQVVMVHQAVVCHPRWSTE